MMKRMISGFSTLLLLAMSSLPAFAIGVSPATLMIDNLLAGGSVESSVFFSRSNTNGQLKYTLQLAGAEADYVSFPNGDLLTFEDGEQQVEVPVLIESGNLATGTYKVSLSAQPVDMGEADSSGGTGTRILSGVEGLIEFSVSNEATEEYDLSSLSMGESEVGQPVGFSYLMNNTGNVDTRPARVEMALVDALDPSNSYEEDIAGEKLLTVAAFSEEEVYVLTDADALTPATYTAKFTFYDREDNVVYEDESAQVQVFPEGTLAQEGELMSFESNKSLYEPGEMVSLESTFKNTGTVGSRAAVVVEVYKGEERIEVFKDESVFVPKGKELNFDYEFTPQGNGTYTAKAYGTYGVFETEAQEIEFSVNSMNLGFVIGVLIALAGLVGIVVVWMTGRKKQPVPAVAPAPAAPAAPQATAPTPPAAPQA